MTPTETVQSFFRALETQDFPQILALVDDAIFYENVSLPPARGIRAFEKQMRAFGKVVDFFEIRTLAIAENGPLVLTERVDVFGYKGARASVRVCGTFEVRNGKITLWRDYFDWAQMSYELLAAAPRALLGALRAR